MVSIASHTCKIEARDAEANNVASVAEHVCKAAAEWRAAELESEVSLQPPPELLKVLFEDLCLSADDYWVPGVGWDIDGICDDLKILAERSVKSWRVPSPPSSPQVRSLPGVSRANRIFAELKQLNQLKQEQPVPKSQAELEPGVSTLSLPLPPPVAPSEAFTVSNKDFLKNAKVKAPVTATRKKTDRHLGILETMQRRKVRYMLKKAERKAQIDKLKKKVEKSMARKYKI